jgi:hypothetical protein
LFINRYLISKIYYNLGSVYDAIVDKQKTIINRKSKITGIK